MPLTALVKGRVEEMGRRQKMPDKVTFDDPSEKILLDNHSTEHIVSDQPFLDDDDESSIAGVEDDETLQDDEDSIQDEPEETPEFYDLVNEEDGPNVIEILDDDDDYEAKETAQRSNRSRVTIKQEVEVKEEAPEVEEQPREVVEETADKAEITTANIIEGSRHTQPVERLNVESTKGQSYSALDVKKAARQSVKKLLPDASKRERKAMCHLLTQGLDASMCYDQEEAVIVGKIMVSMVQTFSLKAGI